MSVSSSLRCDALTSAFSEMGYDGELYIEKAGSLRHPFVALSWVDGPSANMVKLMLEKRRFGFREEERGGYAYAYEYIRISRLFSEKSAMEYAAKLGDDRTRVVKVKEHGWYVYPKSINEMFSVIGPKPNKAQEIINCIRDSVHQHMLSEPM